MSVVFATGPHHGRVPATTGNTNRRYVDGASSITVVSLGGGEYAVSNSGTSTISNFNLTSNTIGTTTTFVMSAKLRFPTALPTTSPDLAVSGSTGGNDLYLFFQQSSSKLAMAWGAGTPVVSSSTVTFNVDYTIDVHVDRTANPNVAHWWINGVAQTDCSDAQASGNIASYTWGRDSAATGTNYWRDIRVSTTAADAPLGMGRVPVSVPTGTATEIGTANALARFTSNGSSLDTTFNSADIIAAVSEIPPVVSASSTGVYQRTSSTTSAVSLPMSAITLGGGETVELCTVRVLVWAASATANNLELRAWDGTNETVLIAREDPNGSNSTTTPTWWCAPYTPSGGWTQAKLNAFQVRLGYSNSVAVAPGAHAVYAEFAIDSAPVAAATVTATAAVPAPTVNVGGGGDATVTPSTVVAAASVPAATPNLPITVTATTVVATAAVGAVTFTSSAGPTSDMVAALAAVGAVSVSTGSAPSATTVAAVAAVPAPTLRTGSTIAAASVAGVASVPAATVSASGNVTISATTVAAASAVPAPSVSTGTRVAPTAVAAAAAVGTATIAAGSTPQPAAVAAVAAVPTASPRTGITLTLTTVSGVAAIATPAVTLGAQPQPAAVSAAASISMPALTTGSLIPASPVVALSAIGPVTVSTFSRITYRPNTGTTSRPGTGATTRPFAGTTPRP